VTLRLFNPESRQWSIYWADSVTAVLQQPMIGEFKNGRGEFYGQDTLDGKAILVREIYTASSPTLRHLEVAYSQDGGRTWEMNWKMTDTKLEPDAAATTDTSALLERAVSDANRPADDRARDVQRKPQEVLAFAGVKAGNAVVDLMPGSGYFTRLFSTIVGPAGKVYAVQPVEMDKAAPKGLQSLRSFAGTSDYQNVSVLLQPVAELSLPAPVDLVWTSMNYHDLHDPFMGRPNMSRFNKSVLNMLKPGGLFVVLDHAAADDSGFSKTDDLHRVDPAAVKAEVLAAGFEFVDESSILRNPKDDHTSSAFDPSVRGTTDRFIYRFRKPLR
jgi:predicted methyltransferase